MNLNMGCKLRIKPQDMWKEILKRFPWILGKMSYCLDFKHNVNVQVTWHVGEHLKMHLGEGSVAQ